jgi:hypothetical protein
MNLQIFDEGLHTMEDTQGFSVDTRPYKLELEKKRNWATDSSISDSPIV